MKKIKGRKFSKRLAGAITLALLAAQAGSALAADTYNKQIIESNYAGSVLRTYWQNEGLAMANIIIPSKMMLHYQ